MGTLSLKLISRAIVLKVAIPEGKRVWGKDHHWDIAPSQDADSSPPGWHHIFLGMFRDPYLLLVSLLPGRGTYCIFVWGNQEIWMEVSLGSLAILKFFRKLKSDQGGKAESEWWHDTFILSPTSPESWKLGQITSFSGVFSRSKFGWNWTLWTSTAPFLVKWKNDRNLNWAQWWDVTFPDASRHFPKQSVGLFKPEISFDYWRRCVNHVIHLVILLIKINLRF